MRWTNIFRTNKTTIMNRYNIYIKETLSRIVEIKAESSRDALEEAKRMYRKEEIVLDDGDYDGTDFSIV